MLPGNLPNKPANGLLGVTLVELVNTAGGIDKLLTAGEEGMAFGADADLEIGTGALDVPDFAAGAGYGGVAVLGMDVAFHSTNSSIFEFCR